MQASGPGGVPQDAIARTSGSTVLAGGAWNVASQALPQVYLLLISVIAARFLGPDGMGRQSFIAFVALSTTMLLSAGMALSLMRYVGETLGRRRPDAVKGLLSWAWRIEAGAAAVGGGALVLVGATGAEPESAWILAGLGCSLGTMQTVPNAVLIGAQRWRDASIVGLVTGTVSVPATIFVLAAGGGITGLFAVEAGVSAANLVWTGVMARRVTTSFGEARTRAPRLRRQTARYAAWSSIGVVLTLVVFRRSEFFFLDHYSTDSQIALYSIAFGVMYALTLLFESVALSVVPAFATLFGAGAMDRIHSGYSRALRLLCMAALPVTAAVLALGPETLRLVYGDDYAGSGSVLRVMAITFPLLPLLGVSHAFLAGLGRVRPDILASSGAAVINVALALVLIPRHDAIGAAVANAGAQGAVAIALLAYSWHILGEVPLDARSVVRTAIASALGGAAAWSLVLLAPPVIGVLLGAACGLLTFALAGRVLGVLRLDDADWLMGATRGRMLEPVLHSACRLLAERRPAEVKSA